VHVERPFVHHGHWHIGNLRRFIHGRGMHASDGATFKTSAVIAGWGRFITTVPTVKRARRCNCNIKVANWTHLPLVAP